MRRGFTVGGRAAAARQASLVSAARRAMFPVLAVALLAPASARAQGALTPARPIVRVAPAPLRLDGRVDEAAWAAADSIADFTQSDPDEGAPGSERTVVRFLRTPEGLWIGIVAHDADPGAIRRAQLRRDAEYDTDDHVRVILSPLRDRRTGVLFTVNANGFQHDADLVTFESENADWDGVWDARAQVTARGWEAELFIPWATLRYPTDGEAWDVNVERFIRRKNETQRWRSWRRGQGIRLLENAGQLGGLAGLPPRATLELRPYVASTLSPAERDYAAPGAPVIAPASLHGDVGLDAKLAPTSTTTLDLTLNADFAQADLDNAVINVTRFPLWFPERRSFFTENAGLFDFGRIRQTQLFYSRRIGLTPDGLPVPLVAGARLTGRLLDQQVGVIAARTGGARPATSAVMRLKHDVLERGWIGGIATVESPDGAPASLAYGVDFNFPYVVGGQNLVFLGLASASVDSAGAAPRGYARFVVDFPNDQADIVARFDHVEPGFNPSLGFVQQAGINRIAGQVNLLPRPERWGIRKLDLILPEYTVVLNPDGSLNNAELIVQPFGAQMESGDFVGVGFERGWDRPTTAFDLFTGSTIAAGAYDWTFGFFEVASSAARPWAAALDLRHGTYYDGRGTDVELEGSLRAEPHLQLALTLRRFAFERAVGSFTAHTARLRADWAATPRLNLTAFVQAENEERRLTSNLRLRWIPSPGSDLYVVWGNTWPVFGDRTVPWVRPERAALTVKYVHYLRH